MELTVDEKKTLKMFAKLVLAHKYKIVKQNYFIDSDGRVNYDYSNNGEWFGDNGKGTVDSLKSVDNIIKKFFDETDLDFFDTGGYIDVIFDVENKMIRFTAELNTTETRDVDNESTEMSELDGEIKTWCEEMKTRGIKNGIVSFEGGGDNGYVNEQIELDSETNEQIPRFVADWIERNLSYDWYNNEGGQGTYTFNFEDEIIYSDCQQNYDSTETFKMSEIINFE